MRLQTGFIKKFIIAMLWAGRVYEYINPHDELGVRILMYHRFDNCLKPFKVSANTFSKQIDFLLSKFRVLSLKEIVERMRARDALPKRSLCITVDDGYEDFYLHAYPVLSARKVPATVFLATGFIENKEWLWPDKLGYALLSSQKKRFKFKLGNHIEHFDVRDHENWHKTQLKIFSYLVSLSDGEKRSTLKGLIEHLEVDIPASAKKEDQGLAWSQIREMEKKGIDFGAHTVTHPILTKVSQRELHAQVMTSKREIEEKLDRDVQIFCYPNGAYDTRVIETLKKASFRGAVTTDPGVNSRGQDVFKLKRIGAGESSLHYFARRIFFTRDWLFK